MAFYLTNNNEGSYGVPGFGSIGGKERKEVTAEVAAWAYSNPEFSLEIDGDSGLAKPSEGKIGLRTPLDPFSGYGTGGISIFQALLKAKFDVAFAKEVAYRGEALSSEVYEQSRPKKWLPKVELIQALPKAVDRSPAYTRLIWTMFESTQLPTEWQGGPWVPLINKADGVIVPCAWNKEVFQENGVTRPIDVIPYGLDEALWPYIRRSEDRPFTVVLWGDLSSRKAPLEALYCFQKAFEGKTDVRLIFKTARNKLGSGNGIIRIPDPRVTVINEFWDHSRLLRLLYESDCLLWLSRGEGFGLPPLQAALSGLPVITTTHTGMGEYYSPLFFYGVKSGPKSKAGWGEWIEPDTDSAIEQLRSVYNDRKKANDKAKKAAAYVRNKFSLDVFGQKIKEVVLKYD